jgi:hypothetical protein
MRTLGDVEAAEVDRQKNGDRRMRVRRRRFMVRKAGFAPREIGETKKVDLDWNITLLTSWLCGR